MFHSQVNQYLQFLGKRLELCQAAIMQLIEIFIAHLLYNYTLRLLICQLETTG